MMLNKPSILIFLLALPILGALLYISNRYKQKQVSEFIHPKHQDKLISTTSSTMLMQEILLFLSLFALIIALAQPQWGQSFTHYEKQGLRIILAIDSSESMLAEDIQPSRFRYSKTLASRLIERIDGNEIAVISFAGNAKKELPLSTDSSLAKLLISDLTVGAIAKKGSQLNPPIQLAKSMLFTDSESPGVLIIITDGEHMDTLSKHLAKPKSDSILTTIVVNVASPEGAPIPIKSPDGQILRYKRNSDGAIVITQPSTHLSEQIQSAINAELIDASTKSPEQIATELYKQLSNMEKQLIESGIKEYKPHRYHWPAALALLCLVIRQLLGTKFTTVMLILLLSQNLHAISIFPSNIEKAGITAYKSEQYLEAEQRFTEALSKSPSKDYLILNIANSQYKSQQYDKSEASYKVALTQGPNSQASLIYRQLGNVYHAQAEKEKAIAAIIKGLEHSPEHPILRHNLEALLREAPKEQDKSKAKEQSQATPEKEAQQSKSYILSLIQEEEKKHRETRRRIIQPSDIGENEW